MKVLFINQYFGFGSTGNIVADLANTVNDTGGEAYIAYGVGSSDYARSLNFSTSREYVRHARYWGHLLGLHGRGSHLSTAKLLKWVDKIAPDIIHLHNIHSAYINYPMLFRYARKNSIPVVWTLHDCWCLTGHCMHFFIAGCNKWKTGCKHCSYNGKYKERSIFNNSESAFDFKMKTIHSIKDNLVLVPVSKWLEDILRESHLKDCNIQRIYNGIDLDVFKPFPTDVVRQKHNLRGKYIILGVATSWGDAKGLSDYIKISKKLSDEFQIILIGLSQSQIESLPSNIIGIYRTNSKAELVEYYNAADVVTSLSYGESMGLTPIEGMACGTPAIVYDNTAQPELIDEATGIVVPTGRIDSVILAIHKMKISGKKVYSEKCIERVYNLFNIVNYKKNYMNMYNKLIHSGLHEWGG